MQHVGNVGDAEPVDDRGHLGQRGQVGRAPAVMFGRALGVQSRRRWDHAGGKRQVASGGAAAGDNLGQIEVVLGGVLRHPMQRAEAVFDGGRRERDLSQPVLDVDDGEAHLHVWQALEHPVLFGAGDPAATMNHEDDGGGRLRIERAHDIELELKIVGSAVDDVWDDLVALGNEHGGALLGSQLGRADSSENDQK